MTCDDIHRALADFLACEQTEEGARIATHCLYPSFESVRISVARMGEDYIVHDGSGAFNTAWLHARDEAMILRSLREACNKFHLALSNKAIVAKIDSIDWLTSAILSVANASSLAAHDAVAKIVAAAEEALVDRIEHDLARSFGPKSYEKNVDIRGVSGGMRHFDFVLGRRSPAPLLINGVSPHRNSIAAKYVTFADTEADKRRKFAVHDRELHNDDVVLLQQVASVVPLKSLLAGAQRELGHSQIGPRGS
jgi:hypothetical protein